jgi:hypothetical protein
MSSEILNEYSLGLVHAYLSLQNYISVGFYMSIVHSLQDSFLKEIIRDTGLDKDIILKEIERISKERIYVRKQQLDS